VHLYRRLGVFGGRYPQADSPEKLRALLSEFLRGVKRMQDEQRAGTLIRPR